MGLQPIDLQTMYSQISNAAKMAVNVEQSVALAQKAQQADSVRKNEELNTKVQKTGEDQKSSGVNQNGHNQNEMSGKNNKQNDYIISKLSKERKLGASSYFIHFFSK